MCVEYFTQLNNYGKIQVFSALLNPFKLSPYCDSIPMQFFDLSRQFNLDQMITPPKTLDELAQHDWFLSKIRIEYDCLEESDIVCGQAVLKSNHHIQIELDWVVQDTGHELQVLFKGIETESKDQNWIIVKGARLCDANQNILSTQALSLWLDGILLPLIPHIRREIKNCLNLWDYVEYQD